MGDFAAPEVFLGDALIRDLFPGESPREHLLFFETAHEAGLAVSADEIFVSGPAALRPPAP